MGAAASVWKEADVPNKALPSLQFTGGLIGRYTLLFGNWILQFFSFFSWFSNFFFFLCE